MSDEASVEATGETVGEAKWAALRELERLVPGLDRNSVQFQVVTEGERGLLGVGYSPARVVATAERPGSGDESAPELRRVRTLLERAAAEAGVSATVRIDETEEEIVATFSGPDLGVLIGWHGQTLDALQYLANAMSRRGGVGKQVTIDAGGYRLRRSASLESVVRRSAERAVATGHRVELEPMSAVERKIVHELLKDDPEVGTMSEGNEPHRFVVIVPRRLAD